MCCRGSASGATPASITKRGRLLAALDRLLTIRGWRKRWGATGASIRASLQLAGNRAKVSPGDLRKARVGAAKPSNRCPAEFARRRPTVPAALDVLAGLPSGPAPVYQSSSEVPA